MKKTIFMSCITLFVGIMMIVLGFAVQSEDTLKVIKKTLKSAKISMDGITTSASDIKNTVHNNEEDNKMENLLLSEVKMETAPASIIRREVYDGMTLEELTDKLNRSLGGILAGHGDVIASHSLEMGVDPYLATAIMMHETGNGTSRIANNCYNFGGQKGYGCGEYKRYDTVDEGLRGIIDNLYKNYYAYGLNTVEAIGHKYAESSEWPNKINWYISRIRSK